MPTSEDTVAPVRPHGLRSMVGRNPSEPHRTTTPLELLFDLTLVVAFQQAGDQFAHLVADGHVASAIPAFLFVVLSVSWAWLNFTWFSSAFDTDDWFQRILTLVQMVGVIIVALGIPPVFESIDAGEPLDYTVIAAGYVVLRASLVAMWLRVARQDAAHRTIALRYAVLNTAVQVCWVILATLHLENVALLVVLVVVLWAAELGGHPLATWGAGGHGDRWQGTPWHAHHIVERYGLLVLITLGEVILGTVAAVAAAVGEVGWSKEAVLLVLAGTGLAFGLWWGYFVVPAAPVLARHRNRKWAWGYGHIVLFAALATVGAGLHVAAYALEGKAAIGTVGVVAAVALPVLVFCVTYFGLYSTLFRSVDRLHLALAVGMVTFLVAALVLAGMGLSLGWCLVVVMLAPFVIPVGYELRGYRHVQADVAREG